MRAVTKKSVQLAGMFKHSGASRGLHQLRQIVSENVNKLAGTNQVNPSFVQHFGAYSGMHNFAKDHLQTKPDCKHAPIASLIVLANDRSLVTRTTHPILENLIMRHFTDGAEPSDTEEAARQNFLQGARSGLLKSPGNSDRNIGTSADTVCAWWVKGLFENPHAYIGDQLGLGNASGTRLIAQLTDQSRPFSSRRGNRADMSGADTGYEVVTLMVSNRGEREIIDPVNSAVLYKELRQHVLRSMQDISRVIRSCRPDIDANNPIELLAVITGTMVELGAPESLHNSIMSKGIEAASTMLDMMSSEITLIETNPSFKQQYTPAEIHNLQTTADQFRAALQDHNFTQENTQTFRR